MGKEIKSRNPIRQLIHSFVFSVCAVSLGITPPPEEKELLFLSAMIGAVALIVGLVVLFAFFVQEIRF